jgi:hypothetical protein
LISQLFGEFLTHHILASTLRILMDSKRAFASEQYQPS